MKQKTAEERAQARFDKEQSYIDFHNHHGYLACIREEVEPLEAENAKLLALVQELVDDMRKLRIEFGNRTGTTTQIGIASLGKSEQHGFVPTNTKEDNG